MTMHVQIGTRRFLGRLERDAAPRSVAFLESLLPLERPIIHARWSGEALWSPFPSTQTLPPENCTCYPRPGQILIYGGGVSEPEILVPYGAAAFASKAGMLAGNHVITLLDDGQSLAKIGHEVLWAGSQTLRLSLP